MQPESSLLLRARNSQKAKLRSPQPHLAKPAAKRAPSRGDKRKKLIRCKQSGARTDGSNHHSKNRSNSPHKNRRRTPKNSRQNNSAGPAVRVPRRRRAGAPTARAAVGGPGDPPGVPRARRDLRRLPREGYKWPGVQGPLSASCAVPSSCLLDGVVGTTSRRWRENRDDVASMASSSRDSSLASLVATRRLAFLWTSCFG